MNVENSVLDRANFLRLGLPLKSKEECLNQAILELVDKNYFMCTAQMFDILISDAKDSFRNNILKRMN